MQSSAWATFKRNLGYEVLSLGLFQEDHLIGFVNGFTFKSRDGAEFLTCPEGPVLDWSEPELARHALRELTRYVETNVANVVGVRIQPQLLTPAPRYLKNWSRGPLDITPDATLFVDLTLDEAQVLAQMKPKGRYNLRQAQKHGVEVVARTDVSAMADFHSLFQETACRNGIYAEGLGFFLDLAAALFPSGMAELLLARWNGRLLGGLVVVYFGRRATYLYGGSTSENRNVMPNYALQWEAVNRARVRGCSEYDFYGIDAAGRQGHLYAGISRFKAQWGGNVQTRIGTRDYLFYGRVADEIVDRLMVSTGPKAK